MATATRTKGRSATSKAKQASKKAAGSAAAKNAGPSKRELALQRDLELAPKVLAMREDGKSWADVKTKLGVDQPKGQVLIKMAAVRPKDRIKAADDTALGKLIVTARDDDELSWADIAVRAGITMGKVKSLYEAASGGPAGESRVRKAAPKAAPKAHTAKATAAKAKPAAKAKAKRSAKKVAADPS